MISMILLVMHAVQALNESRVPPEDDQPESMRPASRGLKKVQGEGERDRELLRTALAGGRRPILKSHVKQDQSD